MGYLHLGGDRAVRLPTVFKYESIVKSRADNRKFRVHPSVF